VGLFEEGSFRCYLQFTLTRGINFWWALAIVAALCLDLLLRAIGNGAGVVGALWLGLMPAAGGNGALGVYAIALLGLLPCLLLYLRKAEGAGFWQAAWVTSTLFGFIHTGNNGENWIGIFAAALIGFVFCVSVRLTGSAWWAIGCHSAWDWAETYFYGTADSGLQARGHLLSTSPAGNPLWSGGADGPEGSLLVLGAILLLLAALLAIHGRRRPGAPSIRSIIADGWETTNPVARKRSPSNSEPALSEVETWLRIITLRWRTIHERCKVSSASLFPVPSHTPPTSTPSCPNSGASVANGLCYK
jgi:hypothetical protein